MAKYTLPVGYRLLFAGLTLAYLYAEFGFNADLLDLSGGVADPDEVTALETRGRILSGIAAVLLVAKWLTFRFKGRILIALLVAAPIGPAVYRGQGELIERLVADTTGEERQIAAYAAVVPSAVLRDSLRLEGLDLSDDDYSTPEGKTFFAIFPALAYLTPGFMPIVDKQLERVMGHQMANEIGPAEQFYNTKYVPAVNDVKSLYNKKYVPASNGKNTPNTSANTDTYWNQYQKMLLRHGIDPLTAERHTRDQVLDALRRKGIKVGDDFDLTDREAFDEAVGKMASPSRASFSEGASKALGFKTNIGPGLSWPEFAAHPDVQRKVLRSVNAELPKGAPPLKSVSLSWSPAEVERRIYAPTVTALAKQKIRALRAENETFAAGGINAKTGENAMRRVLVPPVALAFSLFFSVFSLLSLFLDLLAMAVSSVRPGMKISPLTLNLTRAGFLSLIILVPLQVENQASESKAFQIMMNKLRDGQKGLQASGLAWAMKAEPLFYPIARTLTRNPIFVRD